jgi:hypothetical protein
MNRVEQIVREVSDLRDFAFRMGWLHKTPEYQVALRAIAKTRKNTKRFRAKNRAIVQGKKR